MAQQFIRIGETRLRVTTIKKYLPYGKDKLNVYFNTSRNKVEVETFTFNDELLRVNMIEKLDILFGL